MGSITVIAALLFTSVTLGAIAFQLALAAGAPWGAYAMGGRFPGRMPPAMRIAALGQAALLGLLILIVLAGAGLAQVPIVSGLPSLIWLVVGFSALSLVLNAASRSPGERRIWVPVAVIMLGSSLVVALTGP
jgi:hypothetical protein